MGGGHGFRLSDIMPNAWFYKLTNKNKNKNRSKANSAANTALLPNRPSLYFSGRAQVELPSPSPSPAPALPRSQAASVELAAGFNLPPIATKPAPAEAARESSRRPLSPGLRRLRTPASSPRLASRRAPAGPRGGRRAAPVAARSVAVVKASADPHRDFRESMVEMIVENGLSAPGDLEELLACYLSLNSDEYHGVIVKAFEQIWFDLGGVDP